MERVGDILRDLGPLQGTWERSTPTSSTDSDEFEESVCPICKGAGFLRVDLPPGHPDFGKLVLCRCRTESITRERKDKLERLSNLGPLVRLTFDTLLNQGRSTNPQARDRFHRAYNLCREYARSPEGWLVLLGPSGCGKTHLAAAIANERIAAGQQVLFVVVPDLLDHLRSSFSPSSEVQYDELFENVKAAPLLVLDDLGTQSATPWAQEKLYQIFNHRYNCRFPTIITSNRSLAEIEERLRSRMMDPELGKLCVVDERPTPAQESLSAELPELLREMTFEGFDCSGPEVPADLAGDALRKALVAREKAIDVLEMTFQAARAYAEEPHLWLVLLGPSGCGKTHLAAAIANSQIARGKPVFFMVVPDLLDYLRSAYAPESKIPYDELFETIRTAPLLVLDDLGAHSGTPWAEEKLYQLVNHRYNHRLPTVITTNIPLPLITDRLASRMADLKVSAVLNMEDVPSYRPRPNTRAQSADGGGRGPTRQRDVAKPRRGERGRREPG